MELSIGAEALEGHGVSLELVQGRLASSTWVASALPDGSVPRCTHPRPKRHLPLHPHPDTPPAHEVVSGRFSSCLKGHAAACYLADGVAAPILLRDAGPHAFTTAPPLHKHRWPAHSSVRWLMMLTVLLAVACALRRRRHRRVRSRQVESSPPRSLVLALPSPSGPVWNGRQSTRPRVPSWPPKSGR